MTYNEYKALVEEYYETDSVLRKNEIGDKLFTALVALTKRLEKLYNKYGTHFIDDSEWRSELGRYKLTEVASEIAVLHYYNHWRYGGECNINILIPTKFFDVAVRNEKEKKLKQDYISRLKVYIENNDKLINDLKRDKSILVEKLAKLENAEEEKSNEL